MLVKQLLLVNNQIFLHLVFFANKFDMENGEDNIRKKLNINMNADEGGFLVSGRVYGQVVCCQTTLFAHVTFLSF